MTFNYNFSAPFRYLSSGSSRTACRCRHEKIFLLVAVFAVSLMVIGVGGGAEVQHTVKPGQIVASDPAPYHLTGNTWSIPDLSASQSGYAFAQTSDSTSLTAGAFVTTWRTTSADESITLPLVGTDITINWGDGNTTAGVSTPVDHTYNTAGDYTVQITGGLTWFHLNNAADASKLVSLDQWGTASWASMENAFSGASNMVYNAGDAPDLSGVTDMSNMFDSASSFNGDLSSWDVSKVTDMSDMFIFAYDFNGDLSSWDVSSVTNMNNMFAVASSFNQPLNDWDVSSVTDMSGMFYYAYDFNQPLNSWDVSSVTNMNNMFAVASSFNQPLNDWDVSSVTYMSGMFADATDFNQPLNSWNVSRVTNMDDMFYFATAFSQNLGEWYVVQDPPVLTANAMFPIRAQNSYLDGLVSTYSIDDTRFVMDGKTLSLNSTNLPPVGMYPLDITAPAVLGEPNAEEEGHTRTLIVTVKGEHRPFITTWTATDSDKSITLPMKGMYSILWGDGSNSTNVSDSQSHTYSTAGNYTVTVLDDGLKSIFIYDSDDKPNVLQLKSIDQWGDTRWTTMYRAFDGATNMVYRATDAPDLSDVDDTGYMFYGTSSFNGNLSSWDVSSVTHMEYMFASTSSFNGDLSSWDVSSVTDMSGMFFFATVFNQPLNDWDVSSVSEMGNMFISTFSFNQNLGNWYVVANATSIARADVPGVVAEISAQNDYLNGHNPTYGISRDNDYAFFEIVNGNKINMTSVGTKSSYMVNVTASGSNVFEDGNNWRMLEIKVTDQTTDTTPPVIKLEGSSLVTITVDETYTEQGAVCDDDVDADKPATVGGDTVDTSTVGQYTVTYDCTDSSNNVATQVSRTVNVQSAPDTDAPVIIITGSANIQLTVDETYTEQGAVCDDDVDADKPATVGGDTVDTSTVGQYTVTYDCTDSSNNVATQVSRTVNVQSAPDTDAPVIIITGSANIQLTVDETYTEQGAVCDDDVDADKPATVGGDTVDTSTVGQYTVTYDCTDSSNNVATQVSRTVNVQSAPDTDAPVIIITGSANIQLTVDETYTEQGAVCDDDVDADKPATVGGDTVDTSTVGQYTVTYDCTDSSNNEATQVSRTVNVQSAPDTDAPVIIITGSANIQLTVDETYTEQGAVCDDDVDADKPATVGGDTVDTSTVGQYTVTYDCTDSSNNVATQVSRTVNVQSAPDTDAPVIIITGSANIQLTVDETYTEQGAVCDDDVDADKPATVGGDTVDTSTVGQYTVTYDCTDSSNNEATQVSRTVNVQSAPDTDNADLGGLTISSGTLSPQFSSSDITYTASVDNSVTQVTVTPTASDSSATIAVNGNTVTSGTGYILTGLTVGEPNTVTVIVTAQDSTTKTYIITVTVRDVPITVSSAAYNPGNGQLTITFNQDIATVDYSRLHVRSSANPDTGGITLSSVTGADYSGRTITATLDSEQQDQYDALQSPHLVVEDGAVTDTDGDRTTDVQPQPIRDASQKGSSSSPSSKASIVHINALAQSRLVDIPPHIAEQVASHDASDPLEPITPDDTFDLPLVINGYGYLLDAYENTLIPQTVTAGDNPVHITFTVYTEKEFVHFILYLNLQGRNTNYADSDTYITYKDDGTTSVTDPHGYIGSATVTVTQEDDQIPEKRTVRITIEFGEEPMGPTNMVAYMWNTDRKALFVKIIDALEVVAASPESAMQAADPEPLEPDSVLPADPEPVTPDFADDAADPEPVPYDILGPDDYDDTQILQIIRMWSGFESESITDEQLLELLGLDDHQGADIPDWMMTELGVLVAKGTVTVDEFMLALQYVLEHD